MDIKTYVGVVGAGTMGAGIAQVAAAAGHQTFLTDANPAMLIKARENHQKVYKSLVEKGKITREDAEVILSRITYSDQLGDLEQTGFIIEAILENLEAKQNLFSSLETIVSESCILASNTSSLSITSVASACRIPQRVIGVHFFNPAPLMPLVEIIPALTTDQQSTEDVQKLISSWGKITVKAKDTPGFIVNRIARPFYGEAIRILEEGIADIATIDWAMREGGFRMGPFELMDFIGNDINFKVTETVWEQFFYDPRYKPSLTQKRLFEAKHFGRKNGKGYYDYSTGGIVSEPKKDLELSQQIFKRILAMLINEAVDGLYLQIATRDDLDLAMTKGVNYPQGLLKWADEMGLPDILNILQDLYETYSEDRYRPSVLLKRMVQEGKTFY